ncbi:33002_t:CDS:1, partial [Racocetra persica]
IDNENLLSDWITPDTRMGFIRGNYLDVYGVAFVLCLVLCGGFAYALLTIVRFFYLRFRSRNVNSQTSLKPKR